MTPGEYLATHREAAGFGVRQAAATLAVMPWAARLPTARDVTDAALRLVAAEENRLHFSRAQAETVRCVFAFDVDVYCALVEGRQVDASCLPPTSPVAGMIQQIERRLGLTPSRPAPALRAVS